MKKKFVVLIAICVVLTVIGGLMIMLFGSNKTPAIGEFDLVKYQWAIEQFPSDKNIGSIDSADTAIEKAKKIWIEKYGSLNKKPIEVYFDKNSDCWYLHGTLPKNWDGGVPEILVKSNGDVLAVWHSQ